MRSHKKLELWKFVMEFITSLYAITKKFPNEEKYGLALQIKRASVSIV